MWKVPEVGKSLAHLKNFKVRLVWMELSVLETHFLDSFVFITQPENPPNRDPLIYVRSSLTLTLKNTPHSSHSSEASSVQDSSRKHKTIQTRRTQRIPERALDTENKGKKSSSVDSKCGQAKPGKLVGPRTTLAPGINGMPRLSAKTEEIK